MTIDLKDRPFQGMNVESPFLATEKAEKTANFAIENGVG